MILHDRVKWVQISERIILVPLRIRGIGPQRQVEFNNLRATGRLQDEVGTRLVILRGTMGLIIWLVL